ncbi:MAG: M23 family metallopeptidase [Saprospiraceae bacterium]|nr:M23 family metallopeptidase [Saprospiraceae bacterium]
MSSIKEKSLNWLGKLRNAYRLVIMNEETFQEVGSYKLSLLNVYVFLSTIVVIVALAVGALIFFTPVKRYVPGYGSVSDDREMMRLSRQVADMEKELSAFRTYSENVRRMLLGDVQTEKDVPKLKSSEMHSDSAAGSPPEIPVVDEELRREVALGELGVAAREPRTSNFSPKEVPLEQLFFSPPIKGKISAGFDADKKHWGTDVIAPQNTAIKSVMDGYVFFSDWTLETGNSMGIQHANNVITFYKHNSALLKKTGSFVKAGEAIAIIGNTGTLTDGPHLHFELWHKGKPVNPIDYIKLE